MNLRVITRIKIKDGSIIIRVQRAWHIAKDIHFRGVPQKIFKFIISQIKLSRILNTISFYFELGVGRSRLCFFTLIQGVQFAKTYRSKIYLGYVWLFRSM